VSDVDALRESVRVDAWEPGFTSEATSRLEW